MSKYNRKCGSETTDNYDDYTYRYRRHTIEGEGSVTSCNGKRDSNYEDYYYINEGITKLCNDCFSVQSISCVKLPNTLETIGDNCFSKAKIKEITLPTELQKIGHYNFPCTLEKINIPKNIKEFFTDNIKGCNKLNNIVIDEENKYYNSKDGILYNYDMTEILFCPRTKTGNVIIPNSVKKIGDYCFANCNNINNLIVPPSVTEIGKEAFCSSEFKRLKIPNSVQSIGERCFYQASISEEFKFSNNIFHIPNNAFQDFACKSELKFVEHLEFIGEYAFSGNKSSFPKNMSLFKTKELQNKSFERVNVSSIELFSSLEILGESVFDNPSNDITVRFFSYTPIKVNDYTFNKIGENATLVVPVGTKNIFKEATPWCLFPHIEEWDTNINKNKEGEISTVSDEIFNKRLQSIANSKINVNRDYLKEIISEIAQSYLDVKSDAEFNDAASLIAYNRNFYPAIIPELEKQMCNEWSYKYKLKLLNTSITRCFVSPQYFIQQDSIKVLPQTETEDASLQISITEQPNINKNKVEAYFNKDILAQLLKQLATTEQSVKIAVSWFTNYILFEKIKQMAEAGINIQLITNNDLINNGGYCLNLNELIQSGVNISLVEYPHLLHHKFVIIDNNILMTGSYNWTRFSNKNYENMLVINDEMIVKQFCDEFDTLIESAEQKHIEKMPEHVKDRPEYDRSAFKQYITEELDAKAMECSDTRDKISTLKKAFELNSMYLEKINKDAFEVIDAQHYIQNIVLKNINQNDIAGLNNTQQTNTTSQTTTTKIQPEQPDTHSTSNKVLTKEEQEAAIESIKASELIICLDVSGSMSNTYKEGHVHEITKKALAASLTLTSQGAIDIWTFGNDANFEGTYNLEKINKIKDIQCKSEGTNLNCFVGKIEKKIKDNALCIIFTDDDSKSISSAVAGMKQKANVFWQIISYKNEISNIKSAIINSNNISVVELSNYKSKTDEEIQELLLKKYLVWKNNKTK